MDFRFYIYHYLTDVDNNKCVIVIINNCVVSTACRYNLDIEEPVHRKG